LPVDFQEELDRNTFTGEHIDFDPCGRVTVNAAELSADVRYTPRFCVGNYSELGVFGTIGESTMEHFQQGVNVTGTMTIGGETITLNCRGIRDRTWATVMNRNCGSTASASAPPLRTSTSRRCATSRPTGRQSPTASSSATTGRCD
jgi:hypothetical protein